MFLIRENAKKILVYAYSHCDYSFQCSAIDCIPLISEGATDLDVVKCKKYLIDSKCIHTKNVSNKADFEILVKGIDLAEDIITKETL